VIGVRTESDIGLVTSLPVGPLVPIDRGAPGSDHDAPPIQLATAHKKGSGPFHKSVLTPFYDDFLFFSCARRPRPPGSTRLARPLPRSVKSLLSRNQLEVREGRRARAPFRRQHGRPIGIDGRDVRRGDIR
jgi:hypothetical protein